MSTLTEPLLPSPTDSPEAQRRFEALLAAHQKIVLKVASIYAYGRDDRLDLGQEICAQLWRAFAHYDASRPFSTWMYRIALNVAISHVRREVGSRQRFEPLVDDADALAAPEPEEPDARLAQLDAFITTLEPLNRALMLLVLDERSHAEIAEVLGISTSNVATKINRIKQRLRDQFAAAQPEQSHGTR
ncbi:sigma-70 family RNA polymerase sigma factor [soil metagenome]